MSDNKRYVMIALVGDQTIPNIVPVIHPKAPKFEEICFFYSGSYYNNIYKRTEQVLVDALDNSLTCRLIPEVVKHDDDTSTYIAAKILMESLRVKYGEQLIIVCNVTGGTKLMSAGLQKAAREHNCPEIYYESSFIFDRSGLVYNSGTKVLLTDVKLSLKHYLWAYGLEPKARTKLYEPTWLEISEYLYNVLKKSFIGSTYYISIIIIDRKTNITTLNKGILEAMKVAEFLKAKGLLTNFSKNNTGEVIIEPTNGVAGNFLGGDWLEYYVYKKLKEKIQPNASNSVEEFIAQGVEIGWQNKFAAIIEASGVDNELDVMFIRNAILTVISCKMAGPFRNKDEQKDATYELETQVRSMGTFVPKALVLAQQKSALNEKVLKRAEIFGIIPICFEDLETIADKLVK